MRSAVLVALLLPLGCCLRADNSLTGSSYNWDYLWYQQSAVITITCNWPPTQTFAVYASNGTSQQNVAGGSTFTVYMQGDTGSYAEPQEQTTSVSVYAQDATGVKGPSITETYTTARGANAGNNAPATVTGADTLFPPADGLDFQLSGNVTDSDRSQGHTVVCKVGGQSVEAQTFGPIQSGTVSTLFSASASNVIAGDVWTLYVDGVEVQSGVVQPNASEGNGKGLCSVLAGQIATWTTPSTSPTPSPTPNPTPRPTPTAEPSPTVTPAPASGPSGSPDPVPSPAPAPSANPSVSPVVTTGTSQEYSDLVAALDTAGNQVSGNVTVDNSPLSDISGFTSNRGHLDDLQGVLDSGFTAADQAVQSFTNSVYDLYNNQGLPSSLGTVTSITLGQLGFGHFIASDVATSWTVDLSPYLDAINLIRLALFVALLGFFIFESIDAVRETFN